MQTEVFYPAPEGLPVLTRPARGSADTLKALSQCDWNSVGKAPSGELLQAGALWLHGFLDESHHIAQRIDSSEGAYWHALMHRSEGDFSNSKYWYRRVGRHEIFPDLLARVRKLSSGSELTSANLLKSAAWDPFQFVDAIEKTSRGDATDTSLLQAIAREEYNLLMGYCLARL